ncbi:uncharacterized protein LOC129573700 [Sitodiplosis mosellana]|uniref:uncharacterized protein LOC129573700 n=1 Tax=Sitodiplosis mosellana TaxID=263140 RepID=UPI002444391D|nr:uncharacterized protein LOC129573700 [Sitodiplosis mosellana]
MAAYGSKEFAKIDYDAWAQTRSTLVYIARMIVGRSKYVVVIVGDKLPEANSLGFGYSTTKVHGLFKLLDEHPQCTVYYGSEHRTSKCCCRCGQVLLDARMGESRSLAEKEDRRPRDHRKQTEKSRTKVCLMCKPMDLKGMLPMMRSPLPEKTIYVLKNKRELQIEREAANKGQTLSKNQKYAHLEKITWKSKHTISKTTGKRFRRRKTKWRMRQIENDDIDVCFSIWKRHQFNGAYALDAVASRSLNRDINASINIRKLFYCDTYDVSRPANFTEPAPRQNDRTKRRRLEMDEARISATKNYHRTKSRRNNPNVSGLEPQPVIN